MQHFPLTEKLHTDVLEEKYGPIHTKVLLHNTKVRESLLLDSKNIARTYALTFLEPLKTKEVQAINKQIQRGEAIGRAFRNKGYSIRKNVLAVYIVNIPVWLQKEFHTQDTHAKARLAEFYAKKANNEPIIYGIVTEIYTPDFRKPLIHAADREQVGALTSALEKQGFSKSEIYRRIGDDNTYDDQLQRFHKAQHFSQKGIALLKKNVEKRLQK